MTFLQVANVIRTRYQSLIEQAQSLPTQYDNHNYTPPASPSKWARATVLPGESRKVSIGTPGSDRFRTPGLFVVQVFTPIGQGDNQGLTLAEAIKEAFQSITVSGVVFQTPYIVNVGRDDSWWQINVNCPYYADDIT